MACERRPEADVYVPLCNATSGRLWIQPSGMVTVEAEGTFSNAQCFTSLEGVSFGAPPSGPLTVTQGDFDAPPPGKITVTVTLNKPVDPSTVVAGTSVVLGGQRMPNAAGSATVNGSQLMFTTNATWDQIVGPGGPDTGFTLTLKAAVRAADGGQMQQCKTRNATPGAEPLGDCVLTFVIPG